MSSTATTTTTTDFKQTLKNLIKIVKWKVFNNNDTYYLTVTLKPFTLTIKCNQDPNMKTKKDVINDLFFNYRMRCRHITLHDYIFENSDLFEDADLMLNSWKIMNQMYNFVLDYCEFNNINLNDDDVNQYVDEM